ncbi:MAG: ASCH domain-containing protein [Bacillota bacterium]
MKTISLMQPWASLIATGAKQIETRSRPTKYRGPLAIHASIKNTPDQKSMMSFWHIQTGLAPLKGRVLNLSEYEWPGVKWEDLPFGAIIAVCSLVDCVRTDNLQLGQIRKNFVTEESFGDYSPDRYAWFLENVRMLPDPMPAKGSLGLWNWEGVSIDV